MQTAQNLVLDLELGTHRELRSLLDLEWVVLQALLGAGGRKIDDYVGTAGGGHGERENDAVSGIGGVADVLAIAAESERFFVALEGFVIGV